MERHWEDEPEFPSDPYSELDLDTYRTVLTDVLRTFLRQPQNLSPAVIRLMDNKVPLRSDAQRTNILDTVWAFTDAYNGFGVDSQLHCCCCSHAGAFAHYCVFGMQALAIVLSKSTLLTTCCYPNARPPNTK